MKMKMKQMECRKYYIIYINYCDQNIDKCCEQGVVGDQLTVERGINALMEVSNGFTSKERKEGLHFEAADFHGGMKFLEVCRKFFQLVSITWDILC